mmetsp:Transcript_2723/g.5106  ORF Transcript_2723/g.5106 Transcript_2723/m.5106 type:complete len:412 (+) Transcript_2723:42-1277(+)
MSGDVGRANKPYPGYAGYVPSWSIAGTTKTTCGPTERLNVSDRHLASQPDKTISAPGKTVYASDCAVTVEKKSPREPVVPAHKQSSPSKGFVGSTMQRDAAVTLTGMPKDDKYYTNLKKMQAQDLEAHVSLTEHNRKGEALLNSKKGRGGATGLACLHQPPAVSQASERRDPRIPDLPPSPKHGSEASPMMSPQASEGPTGGVKLNRGNMAPTSYSYTFGRRGENPRDRMPFHKEHFADCSTTHDLACGTAKSVASKRIPGYMGHVPSNPSNVQKIRGDEDSLTKFHKANLMLTCTNDLPGYSGHKPHSIYNDTGRALHPDPTLTTTGTTAKYVAEDTIERAMNNRDHAKSNELKAFFSRGEGEDVGQVADSYFQKFRPLEGLMKSGPAAEHAWISEQQLRRSYITGTTGE